MQVTKKDVGFYANFAVQFCSSRTSWFLCKSWTCHRSYSASILVYHAASYISIPADGTWRLGSIGPFSNHGASMADGRGSVQSSSCMRLAAEVGLALCRKVCRMQPCVEQRFRSSLCPPWSACLFSVAGNWFPRASSSHCLASISR